MLVGAFPAPLICEKAGVLFAARWASDAIRPAKLDHSFHAHIGIGKVPDGFYESFGFLLHSRIIPKKFT
jgi:hypothetical protein